MVRDIPDENQISKELGKIFIPNFRKI